MALLKSFDLSHSFHVHRWPRLSVLCSLPAFLHGFLCGRNSLCNNQIWLPLSCPKGSLFCRQWRTKSKLNLKFKVLHDCSSNDVLQSNFLPLHWQQKLHSSAACAIHSLFPPGKIQLQCQGSAQSPFVRHPIGRAITASVPPRHFLVVLSHCFVTWGFSC